MGSHECSHGISASASCSERIGELKLIRRFFGYKARALAIDEALEVLEGLCEAWQEMGMKVQPSSAASLSMRKA